MSPETLKLYSSHLAKYCVEDVRIAVSGLSLLRRKEGETAFPDLATIDDAAWEAKQARLRTKREQDEKRAAEVEARHRLEHPEEYVHVRDVWAEFIQKRNIAIVSAHQPPEPFCEHCNGVQLSALRSVDLRALADVVEKREQLEAANGKEERTATTEGA